MTPEEPNVHELVQLAQAMAALEELELPNVFIPGKPDAKPTDVQKEILEDWSIYEKFLVAGNQVGKSQIGARIVSWWLQDCHPYMKRPAKWGNGPLKIIILGDKLEKMDIELWQSKIIPYLPKSKVDAGVFKVKRSGGVIQRVTNTENGNMLIFQSHNNLNEARKAVQGYVCHVVWIDEMPASVSLLLELRTRLISLDGVLLATFTPLIRCIDVKNLVDSVKAPDGKKYTMNMLDNPMHHGSEERLLAKYAAAPESERRARLYGEWYMGEGAVINFDADRYIEFPVGYSTLWRHMEMADPADSSHFGFLLAAENPDTHVWYVIKSELMNGDAGSTLVEECIKRTKGVNRMSGVADTSAGWFIKEAKKAGVVYRGPIKANRKNEMIEETKEALYGGSWKVSPECTELLNELTAMQWSETSPGTIVNSRKYHCSHALFYGIDICPEPEKQKPGKTWQQQLVEADDKRRAMEAAKRTSSTGTRRNLVPMRKATKTRRRLAW